MALTKDFRSIASAIVYSIIDERFGPVDATRELVRNRAVRFLVEQHGRMADYLRLPLAVLTMAFDASSLPRHGRRFRKLAPADRVKQVAAWRTSPLGPCRDFVRFYDSLVVVYWYSTAAQGGRRGPIGAGPRPSKAAV